jgi:hypothetical protein
MFVNMDYQDTYSTPEFANVRYPSVVAKSINGWAYVLTKDEDYVQRLSHHHNVEVRVGDRWVPYSGELPDPDDLKGAEPPPYAGDEEADPNY